MDNIIIMNIMRGPNIPRTMDIVITTSNRHISIDVSIIGSLMIDAICISISSN